jgi:hypothetical protein
MMALQISSTADGSCLNAFADMCDSTSAAEPRSSRWGPARAPKAHTRSRNVRMPTVSNAAATSP